MSDASSGCGYVMSKAGIYKLLVLVGGCATFALFVDSRQYKTHEIKTFCLVAYIISFAVSLLLYFFRLIGVALQMQTSCMNFSTFDYIWSWLSSINFISSTILVACFFGDDCDPGCPRRRGFCSCAKQLTALLLGILTAFLYALEAQHLRAYAPVGIGYGTTWRGMWKMIILVFGGTAFGLLVKTGYRCGGDGCTEARTFVLAAWVVAWGVAALFYLFRLINCCANQNADRQVTFGTFEFFWSAFACLLFLIGAAVLAGFLRCNSFKRGVCRERLAADICGWVTAVLFGIDAFFLKNYRPVWFVRSGGTNRVVTTTTTTRRVNK